MATPCTTDPDRWFSVHPGDIARAKRDCKTACPLLDACRKAVAKLETDGIEHGVWAGMTPQERTGKAPAGGHLSQGPTCSQCGQIGGRHAAGLCRTCYDQRYRKTAIRRRPVAERYAAYRELAGSGLSIQQIADRMGITPKAVYAVIQRGRRLEGAA